MKNEIKFIKERIDVRCPRKKIRELFILKFKSDIDGFDNAWEEAHKIEEQPKEEKEYIKDYIHNLEQDYKSLKDRGAKTIDIEMIIHDLMKVRMS